MSDSSHSDDDQGDYEDFVQLPHGVFDTEAAQGSPPPTTNTETIRHEDVTSSLSSSTKGSLLVGPGAAEFLALRQVAQQEGKVNGERQRKSSTTTRSSATGSGTECNEAASASLRLSGNSVPETSGLARRHGSRSEWEEKIAAFHGPCQQQSEDAASKPTTASTTQAAMMVQASMSTSKTDKYGLSRRSAPPAEELAMALQLTEQQQQHPPPWVLASQATAKHGLSRSSGSSQNNRSSTNPDEVQQQQLRVEPDLVVARFIQDVSVSFRVQEPENHSHEDAMHSTHHHHEIQNQHPAGGDNTIATRDSLPTAVTPPADDGSPIVRAKPATIGDSLCDILQTRKGRWFCFAFVAAIVLGTTLAAFTIGFRLRQAPPPSTPSSSSTVGENSNNMTQVHVSATPSSAPSVAFTNSTSPTVWASPTMTPSLTPSTLAPTTVFQLHFVARLPNYTQVSLQDPNSPQSQALQWLVDDHDAMMNWTTSRWLQRYALATLYYATTGIGWRSSAQWMSTTTHECEWWSHLQVPGEVANIAVDETDTANDQVCNANQEYTHLLLSQNYLIGTLPPEISLLTALVELTVEGDAFVGGTTSPDSLAERANIALSGTIPTQFGVLAQLRGFFLGSNALSGTLPSELFQLTLLEELSLPENFFIQGPIPSFVGRLSHLQSLILSQNALSGPLPTELGVLNTSLTELVASKNKLSGSLPSELFQLMALKNMDLQDNSLSSSLPTEVGEMHNIKFLKLANNNLTGSIRTELGELNELTVLWLNSNQLTGQIPSEIGSAASLRILWVQKNKITGTVPDLVCNIRQTFPLVSSVMVNCRKVQCSCQCCLCNCINRIRSLQAVSTATTPFVGSGIEFNL